MKLLIVGKGYIGNYIFKKNTKHQIIIINKAQIDYTDPHEFSSFLTNNKFDWIINSSGYTGRPNVEACELEKDKCYYYNVTVPLFLTKVANKFKIPIIHIGSGCIYDGYSKIYTEDDLPNFGSDSYRSSFYSKSKDAFEKLSAHLDRYIFRIRIPFNGVPEPKNYIWKIINYDNLISCQNSITNVDNLIDFIYKFIELKTEYGVYNVVNEGSIEAKDVAKILKKYSIQNPSWRFIQIEEAKLKVNRSNCILDTSKIRNINLALPQVVDSLELSVREYKKQLDLIR